MFVSLGVGKNQIPLLLALKKLNIPIIGIDQNPEAIGKEYCDSFFNVSILEKAKILELLKPFKNQIKGIYSRSYGKAIITANEIAQTLALPHNEESSLRVFQDKKQILNLAINHPDLHHQKEFLKDIFNAKKWVIKPKDSYTSFGKQNIYIEENIENVKKLIENQNVLIEPYYEGKEYIFFGLVLDNQLYPIIITQKEKFLNQDLLFCDKRHLFPADLDYIQKYKIFQICNYIIKKTKLLIGPIVAEFIVDKEKIFFIEAAPEVGGEFICDVIIPEITGIPYFEFLVQIYMGIHYDFIKQTLFDKLKTQKTKSMLIEYIPQNEGVFLDLVFPKSLFLSKYYYFHQILKEKHSRTFYKNKNLDRIGVYGLSGETSLSELLKEAEKIHQEIRIFYQ
jgi:hypothetical protein